MCCLEWPELSANTDPRLAALLKKAVAQSKDRLIAVRLEQIVDLLDKNQLSRAIDGQIEVDADLHALLELLLSENRAKSIEKEKDRIRRYIKELNRIIKQEKEIQGRTMGGGDAKRLADEQGKLAQKTGGLTEDMKANEPGKEKQEEADDAGKSESGKAEGGQQGQKGQQGQQGQQGQEGQSQQGSPEDAQQQSQAKNPARQRLEAARDRMKEAEKKLEEAQREGAAEKQEEAIRELEQAKAELEEILRQLREEQITRMLAMLEARFRKIMQMQQEVYNGTLRLDTVPAAQRTHNHEIEASRLSGKESQIVVEVDKALQLMREDGTAVAFPEAVVQIREDMRQVVQRLARAKVGKITQGVEEDIIDALKDMIEALKTAQKDLEDKKSQANRANANQMQDPPLVDALAELRMIRALQMRVNKRTERYSKMIEGEQAENPELIDALKQLAEREERIHRVTRDLEMGKNQ